MNQSHVLRARRPGRVTVNALMRAFVAELAAEGVPNPLGQELTLAAVWDDLCRLAGEAPPPPVEHLLAGTAAASPALVVLAAEGSISALCARLLHDLRANRIPRPLSRPYPVGLVWADLCRLAGERPPAAVRALLDAPVAC